ncbi:hypothetical protein A7982_12363 [Minicystis rosea]|nr:hypothetical protein A7982_12363 [Minicystis rosea]
MMPSLRAGTLGGQLAAGLGPLEARAPALQRTARIERLTIRVEGDEICFALAVAVEEGGATKQLTADKRHRHDAWPEAIELSADGREAERARDTLERWLGEEGAFYAEDLLVGLLDAIVPPPPERSLYAWVARHGLERVNGDGGVITRVEGSEHDIVLEAREIALGSRMQELGQVRLLMAVEKRDRKTGALVDVLEQEVYWGRVGMRAYRLPEPDFGAPPLAGWVEAWRAYMTRRLSRLVEEQDGALPMPMDVLAGRSIFNLAQLWLEEGPLPDEPPRLRIEAGALDRALAQVRDVPLPKIRARLRGRGLPAIHAALSIGRHTIVLAAGTASDRVGDDRVLLLSGDEEPITLLRADDEIQNRLAYTLDGDADSMRRWLRWLAELLVRSGLDREIVIRYESGSARVALSRWLAFAGERDPDEPRYDPRLDVDRLVDGHPHWDAHDAYLAPPPPAEQDRIRREHVPRYHAFQREVLDPSFVGRVPEPASA